MDVRHEPPRGPIDVGSEPDLVARLRDEILQRGPITFARFMERALYEPELGYYRRPKPRPGRTGDFLTAPETHPVFGRALARQLDEVWDRLGRPPAFAVREHGAGEGALAVAILDALAASGSPLRRTIRYQPVEVEAARLEAWHQRVAAAGHADAIEPAGGPVAGVVLANEVLDALPVHRVVRRGDRLLERHVGLDAAGRGFVEVEGEPSTAALAERLAAEEVRLGDGQVAEICLAIDGWVKDAARALARGVLLLIDYGHPAMELYGPRRMAGSLRAYVNHRVHDDVLTNVGRQDLTAHVDLTAVERAAASAGLEHLGTTTQAEFLVGLDVEEDLRAAQRDPATTLEAYAALRSALLRLLDPGATGSFKVVAFGRGVAASPPLAGFGYRHPRRAPVGD
jgi:SAM-dependent MidA family methyltransferase